MEAVGELRAALDLGQARDHSALVAVERIEAIDPGSPFTPVNRGMSPGHGQDFYEAFEDHFSVVHLREWPLGTPFKVVIAETCGLLKKWGPAAKLFFDQTGLGGPIAEQFYSAHRDGAMGDHARFPEGVTITSANKADIVGSVQVALAEHRLHVPPQPLRDRLTRQLQEFQYRITPAGNVTWGASTERAHDDLVLALALAVSAYRFGTARIRFPDGHVQAPVFRTMTAVGTRYEARRPRRVRAERVPHVPAPWEAQKD